MQERRLKDEYFNWLCGLVHAVEYRELARYLMDFDFTYTISLDGNRADDGVDLRYRFGDENNHPKAAIASILDTRPCSVFEMMVALAVRCEEHIMDDDDYGNRTGLWFRDMLKSLGLYNACGAFDKCKVKEIIDRFLDRQYARNGKGGLFTVRSRSRGDLRTVEIWYQMCWYLDELI